MKRETVPAEVLGVGLRSPAVWQPPEKLAWSFSSSQETILAGYPDSSALMSSADLRVGNTSPDSTATPERPQRPKDVKLPKPHNFGKRSSTPLGHWEGVVDRLTSDGFTGTIVPLVQGVPDRGAIEFATFGMDELVDESDADLVVEGAVFYWTIARTSNMAGTVSNDSLVRFRRLPPLSKRKLKSAEREAAEILDALGGDS